MLKCHRSELLALSFGAVFAIAISPNAFAQSKKLSYEQAWAQPGSAITGFGIVANAVNQACFRCGS